MQPSDTVQPIVLLVDKEDPASHYDAVAAAAAASVSAYARRDSDGPWENWVFGRFTKTVRRAGPKAFAKLAAHAPSGTAVVGRAQAVAFEPVTYEDMPKAVRALQVSGTQLPDGGGPAPARPDAPVVVVNRDLKMSTGKAGAQAAHALLAWYLTLPDRERNAWSTRGCPVSVRSAAGTDFQALAAADGAGPLIVDAGLTEIAPNTATAFVAAG
ncbi:aminoacyl-tRNA hydrolase [Arthrobacter sp. ATA002]|uniref:aminoacyl-tRNA hydrolase n=1 Tax=Arthrobacter sp. ATA002 TaxID=2991715 RepID=UPI0022A6B863|nr:aminoacyl-tRNA hydrolase [Arthrobacter sp. ATA002]WAP51622.1 aminoacyl-tRNA hydrolase [Arthrobacter sp. ATA002]